MRSKGSALRELPVLVVVALLVSLFIKSFLVQFFFIPSGSMQTTLEINDRVAVNKIPFISKTIHRGDIVVFRDPDHWLADPSPNKESVILAKLKEGLVSVGIVPNPAKQHLVKRVIGVGGDHVVCCDNKKKITVNGKPLTETYIYKGDSPSDSNFDITVPAGKLWVMGDHRGASADSRFHQDDINLGMVPVNKVVGRVIAVIWPFKHLEFIGHIDALK